MRVGGIVSQDGTKTIEEISKLQVIKFVHTKPNGMKRRGYALVAQPGNVTLGEFVDFLGAKLAKDKVVEKVQRMGAYAFVLVPEDKAKLRQEREACRL